MPRSRLHLVPPIAGLVVALLTFQLGNWQLGRADEKTVLQARIDQGAAAPSVAEAEADVAEWRVATVAGEWVASGTIYLDNRVHAGRVGYHVMTPMRLEGGGWVLVNRGWVAAPRERATLPDAAPPSSRATVTGIVRRPEAKPFSLAPESGQGKVWQYLDLATYRERSGLAVREWVVQQTSEAADGLVRDWPRPDAGIDRHRGYALQWYSLAALSIVLTLAYFVRRIAK